MTAGLTAEPPSATVLRTNAVVAALEGLPTPGRLPASALRIGLRLAPHVMPIPLEATSPDRALENRWIIVARLFQPGGDHGNRVLDRRTAEGTAVDHLALVLGRVGLFHGTGGTVGPGDDAADFQPLHEPQCNIVVFRHLPSELADAERDFRRALELDPGFADAYNNLGHVLRRNGYTDAAEQCFRKALARDPEHSGANLNLGAAMYQQNQPEKAIRLLERGLKEEMTNVAGRYNLGLALHQVGRFDEAVYTYRQVIASGSTDPDVYSNMASALLAMGPAEADNRRGSGRQPPPPYSLDRAVEGVRSRTGGRVLSADTVRRDGRPIYDIKVLTNDGRVVITDLKMEWIRTQQEISELSKRRNACVHVDDAAA